MKDLHIIHTHQYFANICLLIVDQILRMQIHFVHACFQRIEQCSYTERSRLVGQQIELLSAIVIHNFGRAVQLIISNFIWDVASVDNVQRN